jgi:CTP:molybdopterin cytidylyltransferase MocA
MVLGVVLAGRRNLGALRAAAPEVEWEALIPIGGRPMAAYVVAALSGSSAVDRVVVAGPPALALAGAEVVPPGEGVRDSLRQALAAAGGGLDAVVVAAGDAPLLTAAAVSELVAYCRGRGLAFGYPIVSRAVCEARLPGIRRTYVRIHEGVFTGGNCFYLRGDAVEPALRLLERVHADRKRPLRLARLFGWRVVWGLLTGTARLRTLEAVGSRLLGVPAGAWICRDAGVGVDVDDVRDLELCRAALGGGR